MKPERRQVQRQFLSFRETAHQLGVDIETIRQWLISPAPPRAYLELRDAVILAVREQDSPKSRIEEWNWCVRKQDLGAKALEAALDALEMPPFNDAKLYQVTGLCPVSAESLFDICYGRRAQICVEPTGTAGYFRLLTDVVSDPWTSELRLSHSVDVNLLRLRASDVSDRKGTKEADDFAPKERTTVYQLIAILAHMAKLPADGYAQAVIRHAELAGLPELGDTTIRKHIAKAREYADR